MAGLLSVSLNSFGAPTVMPRLGPTFLRLLTNSVARAASLERTILVTQTHNVHCTITIDTDLLSWNHNGPLLKVDDGELVPVPEAAAPVGIVHLVAGCLPLLAQDNFRL